MPTSRAACAQLGLCVALLLCVVASPRRADAGGKGKWQLVSVNDGVRVSRKRIPGSSMMAFRGVMTANVSIGKIIAVFADAKTRRKWVDRWDADRELHVKSPLERTYWIRFDLPFPVSDRDYVLHVKAQNFPKKRVFTADIHSVRHPRAPVRSDAVRGDVERTYYRFEALPGGERTKLTVEVHTDPKGMLPAWLVNIIQKKWPYKTLRGLVRVAKAPGVKPLAAYATWHTPYVAPVLPAAPTAPVAPATAPIPAAAPAPAPGK